MYEECFCYTFVHVPYPTIQVSIVYKFIVIMWFLLCYSLYLHTEVKLSASNILAKWMAIFRGPPTPSGESLVIWHIDLQPLVSEHPSLTPTQPPPHTHTHTHTVGKAEAPSEEHRNSSFTEDDPAKPSKPKKDKADKKSSSTKKRDSKSSKVLVGPPVESIQPPPGPMVALGRPRDKPVKRARDPLLAKSGQPPPPEKRVKGNGGEWWIVLHYLLYFYNAIL